ncbi:MAG: SDR family oxidoreductase [Gammaproteobacteria bacterium]|nr:SDR family oxidoreductase [Gammaproteobacteria bacterium]
MKNLNNKWAIVTGASSGLGVDFATLLAQRGCNLIIVARSVDRLEALQRQLIKEYGVLVEVLALDLSDINAPAKLHQYIQAKKHAIDFLINNAGFGKVGRFLDIASDDVADMLNVNVRTLQTLMTLFLPAMLTRNQGCILNIASLLSFQPAPYFAVYAATKAYVLSLSEAVNAELASTNVRIKVLCPGSTRTEFWAASGSRGNPLRDRALMSSQQVAQYGIELMLSHRTVGIPGIANKLMAFTTRLLPRAWVTRITGFILRES